MARQLKLNLAPEQRRSLNCAMHRPRVALGASIGRFEAPFEYLKAVTRPFSPETRFVLNRILAGDENAAEVRDNDIADQRALWLGEYPSVPPRITRGTYVESREEEYRAYWRLAYPWEWVEDDGSGAIYQPDPDLDEKLDAIVPSAMEAFGFTLRNRRRSKAQWSIRSSILPREILIEFDKGSWSSTSLACFLRIDGLPYQTTLADPFFFSGLTIFCSRLHAPEEQLKSFFQHYVPVFAHVLEGLKESIAEADAVLASFGER